MADNNQPTTNTAGDMFDMAVGLSVLDALGGGGEVYGRRNSMFFNNNVDALGLPRNRFNFLPSTTHDGGLFSGMGMRDVLGGNAEVYGRPNSDFANNMMLMLMGGGIFGLLMGLAQMAQQQQELEARQQQQPQTPQDGAPATATAAAGRSPVTAQAGISAPDEEAPTVVGTTLPASAPVTSTASSGRSSSSATRAPVRAAPATIVAGEEPVVQHPPLLAATAPKVGLGIFDDLTRIVPAGVKTPGAFVDCDKPRDDISVARTCTVPSRGPLKGPGG